MLTEDGMKLKQREKQINAVVYNNYYKLEQRIRKINNRITSDHPQMEWIDYLEYIIMGLLN